MPHVLQIHVPSTRRYCRLPPLQCYSINVSQPPGLVDIDDPRWPLILGFIKLLPPAPPASCIAESWASYKASKHVQTLLPKRYLLPYKIFQAFVQTMFKICAAWLPQNTNAQLRGKIWQSVIPTRDWKMLFSKSICWPEFAMVWPYSIGASSVKHHLPSSNTSRYRHWMPWLASKLA